MNKTIKKTVILLITTLGVIYLSFYFYSTQNSSNLSISLDEIRQIIDDHNENVETYEKIRCDENLEITQTLNSDVNSDDKQELVANLACDEIDTLNGSRMYLLILKKSQGSHRIPLFIYDYNATHSNVAIKDLEEDGKNEIFIRSSRGLGGGSAGSYKGIYDQYIKCDQVECKESFSFWNFNIGRWRNYDVDNIRGAFPKTPFLSSTEITMTENGNILKTSDSIIWVGQNILLSKENRTIYKLNGLEYQKSYQTTSGDSYWTDQRSSYLFWQNNFAEHSLDTGYIYPFIEMPLLEDFSSILAQAETDGLIIKDDIFYLNGIDEREYVDTKLLAGQAKNQQCTISILYPDYLGGLKHSYLTESCTRGSAAISLETLDPQSPKEYIIFSTTFASFEAEKPPYQTVSIYKFNITDQTPTPVQLTKVDHLTGMLYKAALDGVTILCDGVAPCTAKVRTWDFENYSENLSLPHFEYYIWDTEREKFLPQK